MAQNSNLKDFYIGESETFEDNGEPIKAFRCVECGMIISLEALDIYDAIKKFITHHKIGKRHFFESVKHWKGI